MLDSSRRGTTSRRGAAATAHAGGAASAGGGAGRAERPGEAGRVASAASRGDTAFRRHTTSCEPCRKLVRLVCYQPEIESGAFLGLYSFIMKSNKADFLL